MHTTETDYRALLQELQAKPAQADPTRRIMEGAARAIEREKNYSSFTADSTASQGRQVSRFGVVRRLVNCSIGW